MALKLLKWFSLISIALLSSQPLFCASPILIVTASTNPFTSYYTEILHAEGLNAFDVSDISTLSAPILASHDLVIIGETSLTADQVTLLTNWVNGGGNLIALRPDKQLASLLGLSDTGTTLSNGYLLVNTSSAPGTGIVGQTVQFHGTADQYLPTGATTVATLYSTASSATQYPAITLRTAIGSGGKAAAFTYDLSKSVVYTRQGNPAWAGQARVGQGAPIRAGDMFYGAASSDPQPDWIDFTKIAIPQADEQQRLLVNLILYLNQSKKPLPRFWYFPFGKKAAIVMTGDDHALGGTAERFDDFIANSPVGCSVANWECIRATSYAYVNNPLTNSQAANYAAQGFEIAPHITTNCLDYGTAGALDSLFTSQLSSFAVQYPSLTTALTNRTHCIAWDDWASEAQVELNHGIRFDTNYYYWPASWVQNRSGMFTGSGMPMRFAQTDGTLIDVYQAVTQMPDESGEIFPGFVNSLLDNAVGAPGYYGAFTANMHNDYNGCGTSCSDGRASEVWAQQIVGAAQARNVPVVSSAQMLQWLDGRNSSSFDSIAWNGNVLSFAITTAAGSTGLQAMLPAAWPGGALSSITTNGVPVPYTVQTIKGIDYAFFAATAGLYQAVYGGPAQPLISGLTATAGVGTGTIIWTTDQGSTSRVDYAISPTQLTSSLSNPSLVTSHSVSLSGLGLGVTYYYRVTSVNSSAGGSTAPPIVGPPATFTTIDPAPPVITALTATPGATGTATITWTTNKPTTSLVSFGLSPSGLNQSVSDSAFVTAHSVTLNGLVTGTTYYFTATSVDSLGNTVTSPSPSSPAIFTQNSLSVWAPSATPAVSDAGDLSGTEVGMKFRSDVPGAVTAVRFYKASTNIGVHTGNLWTESGMLLGSVTFSKESAAGWQQANFSTPIVINPNVTYIVSYFAPTGHYSVTAGFFSSGIDNSPLHALASGVDGPNGVYSYGSTSSFPSSTFNNNNYWVDVVFAVNAPPVISSVTATTTGTTATITWQTNEPASSRVDIGTSPGALSTGVPDTSLVTAHSATLTGLATGTTYFYRVVSVDGFGNSTTAPATVNAPLSFIPALTVSDSNAADFAAGSGTCLPVTMLSGSAVILPPAVDVEFAGGSLPAGWLTKTWSAPGGVSFNGSSIVVDGADVASGATYPPGSSLEFVATFNAQPLQHVGFAADVNFDGPWILFSTDDTGTNLYERISGFQDIVIPGSWLGAPHLYRIDWTSTGVTFSIDGVVVSTQVVAINSNLALIASDFTPGGGSLSVNWMRLSPYASSCSFLSRVLDAGSTVSWSAISWTATTSPATSLAMAYRTGNTPQPDSSWSSFANSATSGAAITGPSRYIQYQANLASTDLTRSPELQAVSFVYSLAVPPTITTQPVGSTINVGQTATLSVVSTGTAPLNYQWYSGVAGDTSHPMAGATASTYLTPALTVTTSYWVRVGNNAGSVNSATATVTVNRLVSTTSLTAAPNPSVAGQTVTLTATVTAGGTGSVSFLDGSTTLGSAALNRGIATLTTASLSVGSHSLQAAYSGDGTYAPSTSSTVTQVVNLIATKVTLASPSPNPSVTGQSLSLSATVTALAPGTGTPAGSVTFNDGSTVLGTANLSGGVANLTTSLSTGGSHSLTATFAASGNFGAGTSSAVSATVNAASTTTTISSSGSPSVYGQPVTLTATVHPVSPGGGTATGSVTFKDGSTVLGSATLSGGVATLSVASLAIGSHSLTASLVGNTSYAASNSSTLAQTVKQSSTTTVVNVSPTTSVSGQSVNATVTVSPVAPGSGTPTGTVNVLLGSTVVYSATISNGAVTTSINTIPVGSYTFTVSYTGDANFLSNTSAPLTIVVNPAPTTTALGSSSNPSVIGQAITLTSTVSVNSPGGGTATGSVTFKDGTTTLGTATLSNGTAAITTSSLALGSHSLTAIYGGSSSFSASTAAALLQTVSQIATTTGLSGTPNPSTTGQSVTLTAKVAPVAPGTGTATGTVTFKDGSTTLGTASLSSGSASISVSSLALGAHSLTAVYAGNTNFAGSSSPISTQTVNLPATNTALTTTPNPSGSGQSVTLRATVTATGGTPTGTVTFADGATILGTATLSAGSASMTTSALAVGSHSLSAVYGGSANFSGSTSTVVTQTVNPPQTTTVLTSSLNPSVYGQSVTLKAVVSVVSPGTGTPDGSVSFKDGSTVIATATLSGGAAITAVTTLTGGSHTLTAVYTGSAQFASSTSSSVSQSVTKASTATGLTASPVPSVYGQAVTLTATISSSSTGMTGTVTFKDGTTILGTAGVSGSTASLTVTTLAAGTHQLTAAYGGDTNYGTSTSSAVQESVNQAPTTTTVTSSINPSVSGQSLNLKATVTPVSPASGTPTGSVTFKDGSTTLSTVSLSGGAASFAVSSLTAGSHSITAVYNDDGNFVTSTSPSVTQVVNAAATSTALTSSLNPTIRGLAVTFKATVSAMAPGGGTATGSVIFKDGSTTIGTVSLSSGSASLSVILSSGTHSITASYAGSAGYSGSTSSVVSEVVF